MNLFIHLSILHPSIDSPVPLSPGTSSILSCDWPLQPAGNKLIFSAIFPKLFMYNLQNNLIVQRWFSMTSRGQNHQDGILCSRGAQNGAQNGAGRTSTLIETLTEAMLGDQYFWIQIPEKVTRCLRIFLIHMTYPHKVFVFKCSQFLFLNV